MADYEKIISDTAKNLKFNSVRKKVAYGIYNKYLFLIHGSGSSGSNQLVAISFCVKSPQSSVKLETLLSLPNNCTLQSGDYKYSVCIEIKGSNKPDAKAVQELLNHIVSVLDINGFVNCDIQGSGGNTGIYKVKDKYAFLTDGLAENIRLTLLKSKMDEMKKKENFLAGTMGALLGAAAASLLMLLVARIGYVSTLVSLFMGSGIVFGYKWKGVRLSFVSSIICIVISVVFTYLTFRASMAFSILKIINMDFSKAFFYSKILMQHIGALRTYYGNLLLMMICGAGGTICVVYIELLYQKQRFEIKKLV